MSSRVRYGLKNGTIVFGDFSYSFSVPSSGVLDTIARRTPAAERIDSARSGE